MRAASIAMVTLMLYGLLLTNCRTPANPFSNDDRVRSELSIETEKKKYAWQQNESRRIINIQGTLKNTSKVTYYSRIGDGFGPPEQDHLFVAENSAGFVEKFNEADKLWYEVENTGLLIEGSRFVPLQPSKVYSISAYLSNDKRQEEKGKYRLRIDYYDDSEPDESAMPLRDYSNVFGIE